MDLKFGGMMQSSMTETPIQNGLAQQIFASSTELLNSPGLTDDFTVLALQRNQMSLKVGAMAQIII